MTRTIDRPSPATAQEVITAGLDREELVTVFGQCRVDYEGRASSKLEWGDRHLLLKPDGTTLVHTDSDQKPVNWQPPGSTQTARLTTGQLVVESTRANPDERLTIRFKRIVHVGAFEISDGAALELTGTEADLKERILEQPALIEDGFQPLATERTTAAGAIDIYGEDTAGRTVAVELKRRRVGPDAVGQLKRYVTALERELHTEADIRGILVAPSVTDRARRLLANNGLEFVAVEPTAG